MSLPAISGQFTHANRRDTELRRHLGGSRPSGIGRSNRAFGVQALVLLLNRGFLEAYRKLQDMVGDTSPEVRQTHAREIQEEGTEKAALILPLGRDPVPEVRAEAAAGLAAQERPETRERFLELLRDPEDMVREAASDCLYYPEKDPIRPEEALDLRFDPVPAVRAHVARWCSWLPASVASNPLLELTQDDYGRVRAGPERPGQVPRTGRGPGEGYLEGAVVAPQAPTIGMHKGSCR